MFYPGQANVDNGRITVDQALKFPASIEQRIADKATPNLVVDNLFSADSGPVTGGAVIFSKITEKHLYTENDVADRQPGDEYPVLYSTRPESQIARVQDFGGKFAVTDEARTRNNTIDFDNDVTKLSNTITRKINQRAIETVQAAQEADEVLTLPATAAWDTTILDGDPTTITPPRERPTADLAALFAVNEDRDMGVVFTKLLVNPSTRADLTIAYGEKLTPMLKDFGLQLVSSIYVPKDNAYVVDPKSLGFVRYEESLTVRTFRDEHHRQSWVQGWAMPVMGVTFPAALGVISGITTP
ncbi:hypothetical protein EAH68_05345 [Corynebacterium hylobatis]|uniref:Major capsid protein n=1 Tax=Corynebacterium hylobatis TaxID=1859290 RepID=A0A430I0B2_9CORY|nr:major capsid protein [Corynebacterium hylobatis]RSZ64419.1 hypothetical protein EAH68_05345 [Corynebacterium hylobatis]